MEAQVQLIKLTAGHVSHYLEEAMLNECNGCMISHGSQLQHSCLMLSGEDRIRFCLDRALLLVDWEKFTKAFVQSIQFSWQGVVPNSMGWCHLVRSAGVCIIGTRMTIWYLTSYYKHVGIVNILCASSQHLIVYDGRIWAQTECVLPWVKTLWW